MKLLIVVVQDYDAGRLLTALSSAGIGATRIASAGGFLRAGNTTVIIGVEDDRLGLAKRLVDDTCRRRPAAPLPSLDLSGADVCDITESRIGGGVAFVADVERFERIVPTAVSVKTRS